MQLFYVLFIIKTKNIWRGFKVFKYLMVYKQIPFRQKRILVIYAMYNNNVFWLNVKT